MKKDMMLQLTAGTATLILGIVTVIYGVRFLLDETKGNVPACTILFLCCMAATAASLLIWKHNMSKYQK